MRTKGTGGTAVLTQSERLEKARRAEASTTRLASTAFRDLNDAQIVAASSAGKLHQELVQLATGALASNSFIRRQDITNTFDLLGGISTKAVAAASGVALVGTAAAVGVKQLYDLGAAWDDIGDTISGRTGKMGSDLTAITDSIKNVGSQSALSLQDISQLAGGVSQSLHLSGDAATQMTQKLADLQQWTGQAVNTKDLGKTFRLFDVTDVNSEIQVLQQLTAASQSTDIPINDLLTTLSNTGKASKEAGLDLQQTLGVLLTLEDAGVSFDKAGPALSIALKNWSKDGRDANVALAETITKIQGFVATGNDAAATKLASETFGRGYIDFLNAIKGGSLDVNNLTAALQKLGDTGDLIGKGKEATEDWHESWKKLTNTISSKLEPVASAVFTGINSELQYMSGHLTEATDGVNNLASSINSIGPDALAGKLGLPGMPGAPGAPAGPGLPTTRPGTPTTGLAPNFYKDWYKTPEELKREQSEQNKLAKLPDAPVLPYDTTLPSGLADLPQTSGIVGAESSWLDARHTLAEKQARVNQLEHDNNAKADDIQKARNDVINAQQAQQQAELRVSDARQSLYEKDAKQLKGHADQLGEIGAALDQDLGISKGLPGLADNLVRFLASLAAAPLLGQLSAISQANPSKGGYGLFGMLGAQGAFGPQFTGIDYSKQGYGPSAIGPAGLLPTTGLPDAHGSHPQIARIAAIAKSFGLEFTAGKNDHADDGGYHPAGMAGDFSNSTGNSAQELAFANYMAQNFGSSLQELIYSDPNFSQLIGGGKNVTGSGYYSPGVLGEHTNHVHVAMTDQAASGLGNLPSPLPVSVQQWNAGGPSGSAGGSLWDKVAQAESSGNWQNADTGHSGHFGGLQFAPSTWKAFGGVGNPQDATREQQIEIANRTAFTGYNGTPPQGLGAWEAITKGMVPGVTTATDAGAFGVGSVAPPSSGRPGYVPGTGYVDSNGNPTGYNPSNLGGPGPLPSIIPGSAGQGFLGLQQPGGPGANAGTPLGGMAPTANPGGGGLGITPGGTLDTAISLAATGLDAFAPGAGQAAQTGIKLANRAIQYGGQLAGIGVTGLMDTFLPSESPLGNIGNSWFGRIAGGFAGASPALPNMAGQQAPPKPMQGVDPNTSQHGTGQGQPPGPTNGVYIENFNGSKSDYSTANEIAAHHQAAQYQPVPGQR